MKVETFFQLYRKSEKSEVFKNSNLWHVWCFCLIRANYKKRVIRFNKQDIVLLPGQFITGRFEGAKACHMKPSTFRDQLAKLKQLGNIDIKSDNKKSIITIVNWALYQCCIINSDRKTATDNNIINKAKAIIEIIKKESSVYSTVNRFKNLLGEEKLNSILDDCNRRNLMFGDESKLAAYLQACHKKQGQQNKVTDNLKDINPDQEGWL